MCKVNNDFYDTSARALLAHRAAGGHSLNFETFLCSRSGVRGRLNEIGGSLDGVAGGIKGRFMSPFCCWA
jgi:hypothetical protein